MNELMNKIEECNFECVAGNLKMSADWQALRQRNAELEADAKRFEWLIKNEYQVWEVNGIYAVHYVTEHTPLTETYFSAREAIDAEMEKQK